MGSNRAVERWAPIVRGLVLLIAVLALGAGVALVATFVSPLFIVAGAIAAVVAAVVVSSRRMILLAFIGTVTLLPFGVIPVGIGGVRPTAIDITLLLLLGSALAPILVRRERFRPWTPVDLPIGAFIVVSIASFALGTAYAMNPEIARQYAKLVNSILFFYVVTHLARDASLAEWIVDRLIVGGALAGSIGVALYHMPAETASSLLRALRPFGYPSGNVLRYIEDAGVRTDTLRAIGTSIDPNVFGALLLVTGSLAVGRIYEAPSRRAVWSALALIPIAYALLVTLSRGSWLGFAAGALIVTTLRRPRLLWLLPILGGIAIVGFAPQLERFGEHFLKAVFAQDQATGMRLGEYKDALTLIQQNPLLGVGFGGAPSIELYLGVSSTYLLIAEEMGLIGLTLFLVIIWRALASAWRARRDRPSQSGSLVTVSGALVGMLVAALVDRHFFDLRFQNVSALFWLILALVVVCGTAVSADYRSGESRAEN